MKLRCACCQAHLVHAGIAHHGVQGGHNRLPLPDVVACRRRGASSKAGCWVETMSRRAAPCLELRRGAVRKLQRQSRGMQTSCFCFKKLRIRVTNPNANPSRGAHTPQGLVLGGLAEGKGARRVQPEDLLHAGVCVGVLLEVCVGQIACAQAGLAG